MLEKKLLRFDFDQDYLFFDAETENLNLVKDNRPWQLAYLVCRGTKVLDKFDRYIRWDNINVSKEAAKITGFNKKKYLDLAEDPKKVLKDFDEYILDNKYYVCGHNILGFDVYMYKTIRKELGLPTNYSFIDRCIDTNCLAKAIKCEVKYERDQIDFISWQYKFTEFHKRGLKTNLQQLCKEYSIDFDPSKLHDALYDIEKNFEVFHKQLWEIEI